MTDEGIIAALIGNHGGWAATLMFVIAFGESFALLSLLVPGTTIGRRWWRAGSNTN